MFVAYIFKCVNGGCFISTDTNNHATTYVQRCCTELSQAAARRNLPTACEGLHRKATAGPSRHAASRTASCMCCLQNSAPRKLAVFVQHVLLAVSRNTSGARLLAPVALPTARDALPSQRSALPCGQYQSAPTCLLAVFTEVARGRRRRWWVRRTPKSCSCHTQRGWEARSRNSRA